eukprot:GFYU01008402.1.p1 GENE.GFYU01008402.1~~GFYU01008402.1.p1  ORF type:complete len:539 (+),score=157.59 GFYU01008402.1:170-1786(+)
MGKEDEEEPAYIDPALAAEMKEKEEEEEGGRFKTFYLPIGMAVVGGILAFVGVILASITLAAAGRDVADIGSTLDNWKLKPIVELELVAAGASCSTNFENIKEMKWPGAKAFCDCPVGARTANGTVTSHIGTCTTEETGATPPCVTDPAVASILLDSWRGRRLCVRRETSYNAFLGRPRETSCGSGQINCGSYDGSSVKICYPSTSGGGRCPVTQMLVVSGSVFTTLTAAWKNQTPLTFSDTASSRLVFTIATTSGRPVVEVKMTEGKPCRSGVDQGIQGRAFNSRIQERSNTGGCAANDWDEVDASYAWKGLGRWKIADTLQEDTLYAENGVPSKFRDASTNPNYNWYISYREEILWRPKCDDIMSPADVEESSDPLKTVLQMQELVLAFQIIAFIILGLFYPYAVIKNRTGGDVACIPGDGMAEYRFLKNFKKYGGLSVKVATLIPLAIALAAAGEIRGVLDKAEDNNCSDPVTNSAFGDSGDFIEAVYTGNTRSIILDCLALAHALIMALLEWRKKRKARVAAAEQVPQEEEMQP